MRVWIQNEPLSRAGNHATQQQTTLMVGSITSDECDGDHMVYLRV